MGHVAVSVFPVAKPDEWREFVDSAASGERAEAHRLFLRRLGVTSEHIFLQPGPGGDVMVLVWEGVEQNRLPELMGGMMESPQSEHERYIATHVIPVIHGVDPSAGPPAFARHVTTIQT